jgi:hypothetical protein
MEHSKLLRTLRKLNDEELNAFKKFVASPYFNANKELAALLEVICSEVLISSSAFRNEDILNRLSPGRKFEERRLTDLMYRLTNLLEEYLSIEKYRQNKVQQKINLLSLGYEKEFDSLIGGIEKDIALIHKNNPVRDAEYLYETFMFHSEKDYSFRLHGKISDHESIQSKSDFLDLYYFALKLKDACEMINRSRILSVTYDIRMVDNIIDYLREHPGIYKEYPAVQIYFSMYLMLSSEEHEKYFFDLKEQADHNASAFTSDEIRSIYGYLQNYCIRRLNQGDTDYLNHLFGIYKHIFNTGLVFGDNKNMQWDFKNFVSLGLRLKEYEWTLQMINTFKDQLPQTVRQNAYSYNLANYYYETGDYRKATKLLVSVEFTDIYYNLDSKAMLLKIYYKVEEEESFYSLVSSFGIYLRRNKLISPATAEIYHNLLKFTKKSFNLKTKLPYQRKKDYYKNVVDLKDKITRTHKVANINWLLQEVGELASL